jgi:hypothetical protein
MLLSLLHITLPQFTHRGGIFISCLNMLCLLLFFLCAFFPSVGVYEFQGEALFTYDFPLDSLII